MRVLVWIVSIFTILGISVSNVVSFWRLSPSWGRLVLVIGVSAAIVIAVHDLWSWRKERPKHHKNETSINKYLLKLLQRGGSVSIFANHLSWIRSSRQIQNLLIQQAQAGRNIRIYVPTHNDVTRQLARHGVNIITYESLRHEPEARFTLLNPDEPGSSLLAIGKGALPNFYIEEFPDLTHSRVISVARDLLNIIERARDRAIA